MAHRKRKAQEMSESSSSSSDEDVEIEQVQESEKHVESSSDSEEEEQEEEKEVADSSDSEEEVAEREEEQVDDSSDEEEEEVRAEEVEAESSESEEEEGVQKEVDSSDSEEEEEKAEEVESSDSEEEKAKQEVAEGSESEEEQVQVHDNSDSEDEEEQVQDSSDSEEEETKEEGADSSESEKEEENSSPSSEESEHEEVKEKIVTQRQPVKVIAPTEKRQPVKVMQPTEQKKLVAAVQSKEQKSSSAAEPPTKKQKVEPQSAPVKLTHKKEIQLKALHRVLEPFTKYQILEILSNAAMQHKNLYDDLKIMLGSDLVHRKVFVRGLAPTTTTKALKEKYSAFGKVEDTVINKDKSGKSLGDGFVTFSDMEAAQRAVENQLVIVIDGRTPSCHLKDSRDKSEVPPLSDDEIKRRVFVRGLCTTTTSYTLREEFKRFGELERVFVPRNPETKTNKGYGYVVFREETGAKSALEVSEKTIDGRQVKCVPYAGHDKPEFSKTHEPPLGKRQNAPRVQKGARDRKLYFSGDFKRLKHNSLRREFEKFGKVMNFVVPADGAKNGESKGAGVVVYRDEAEAKSALKVQKKTVNGYLVRCWKPSIKSAKKQNELASKAIKAKKKSKRADKDSTRPN